MLKTADFVKPYVTFVNYGDTYIMRHSNEAKCVNPQIIFCSFSKFYKYKVFILLINLLIFESKIAISKIPKITETP